jgi:hypothetical protein
MRILWVVAINFDASAQLIPRNLLLPIMVVMQRNRRRRETVVEEI